MKATSLLLLPHPVGLLGRAADALCLFADKVPINRATSIWAQSAWSAATPSVTQVAEQRARDRSGSGNARLEATEGGSGRFLRKSNTEMCHKVLVKVLQATLWVWRGGGSDVLVIYKRRPQDGGIVKRKEWVDHEHDSPNNISVVQCSGGSSFY